jgi:hypothetical protein
MARNAARRNRDHIKADTLLRKARAPRHLERSGAGNEVNLAGLAAHAPAEEPFALSSKAAQTSLRRPPPFAGFRLRKDVAPLSHDPA